MSNDTPREDRIRRVLDALTDRLIGRLLDMDPDTHEGEVLTSGPPPYRRIDCDGRALAYVRSRPRRAAVRIDLSGLWIVPGRCHLQIPSASGAALLVRSTEDIEVAVRFLHRALEVTRASDRSAA